MRALVLAGGEGSRLRPLTHTQAKQLIPIAGQPILFHALDAIRDAGIDEVGIVIGQTGPEVRAAVGDGSAWGVRVTYIEQEAPLGLAHAVLTAADFVRGEPFLMYLGDNVLLEGVRRFVRAFEDAGPDAQILLARVPDPSQFGVVVLDGERVTRLVEKPRAFVSDLGLVGVYLFDDSILEACATLEPSWRGEYEITEAIQWLVDSGKVVRADMVDGYWKDTGTSRGPARREPDAARDARVRRPGLGRHGDDRRRSRGGRGRRQGHRRRGWSDRYGSGADCVIDGSTIGPDVSIEPGSTVRASTIRDSIVMAGCTVDGVDALEASILGRNADVRHAGGGGAHRLVVGDQSRVEVD
jgi:glucose-1-phosphate thymidylyltransferase